MIREVLINGQRVDITPDPQLAYCVQSPIFRDVSLITSNRTTTYKIPITGNNSQVFELYDQSDVISAFGSKWHTFEEWRDGMPFIKGRCRVLQSKDGYYELNVIWGNTVNIMGLKDLNLRDLKSDDYIMWDSNAKFLPTAATDDYGFLALNFGRGIDIQYSRPCVKAVKILDYIKQTTNVSFEYPERFNEVFNKMWIPLLDGNADKVTWDKAYTSYTSVSNLVWLNILGAIFFDLNVDGGNSSLIGRIRPIFEQPKCSIIINNGKPVRITAPTFFVRLNIDDDRILNCKVRVSLGGKSDGYNYQEFAIYKDSLGYSAQCTVDIEADFSSDHIFPQIMLVDGQGTALDVNYMNMNPDQIHFKIQVQPKNVVFGDPYPIIANLPDLKVIDFIKAIMNMFGVFTYYKENKPDVIRFVSIDDMYDYKQNAENWTDKLIQRDDGRFVVSRSFGDNAQRNYMKYKNDKEIRQNTDGFIVVDDKTLPEEKTIFEIPFSASNNNIDNNYNLFSNIPLFDSEGNTQSLNPRILMKGQYIDSSGKRFMSAHFPEIFKFNGDNGLINTYYRLYQHVLRKPVCMECNVSFNSFELSQMDETRPIFIDCMYFMVTNWQIQPDGAAICKIIKMPPLL